VLFHPTARILGRREPVALDLDAVIAAAVRTGTVLEIDASPLRLDLRDEHARAAVAAGAKLAIDSDAHAPEELAFADELGVTVARRAWVRREDVVNALPVEKLLAALKGGGGRASRAARTARGRAGRRRG
jgi:DNA polymerase (family 10)